MNHIETEIYIAMEESRSLWRRRALMAEIRVKELETQIEDMHDNARELAENIEYRDDT